ncbi:MAG: hypothetical protein R3E66_17800 [bacterium]
MKTHLVLALLALLTGCIEAAPTATSVIDAGEDAAALDASTDLGATDMGVVADQGVDAAVEDIGMDVQADVSPDTDPVCMCGTNQVCDTSGECVCDRAMGWTECIDAQGCVMLSQCNDILGNGIDENLDGADGVATQAVFVSQASGDDGNSGILPTEPVKTLARAAEVSTNASRPLFLLAVGDYTAPPGWKIDGNVGQIAGSYNENFIDIDASDRTRIHAAGVSPTLMVKGDATLPSSAAILGVELLAPNTSDASPHAITLWISDATVSFFSTRIERGEGRDGAAGASRSVGANGGDASANAGGTMTCWDNRELFGGDGGLGGVCSGRSPGAGSGGSTSDGTSTIANGGVAGVSDCVSTLTLEPGKNGGSGNDGDNGGGGSKFPLTAAVAADMWSNQTQRGDGDPGEHGEGGGGGGGGGGATSLVGAGGANGGNGGGGGSGACGGQGGEGGQSGGDSIGIVALNATLLGTAEIFGGKGGNGGRGGVGGCGGVGGSGVAGTGAEKHIGGRGGNGGDGGIGGSGAGGNGGRVIGIAADASLTPPQDFNIGGGTIGNGGDGGNGASCSGTNGVGGASGFPGEVLETLVVP